MLSGNAIIGQSGGPTAVINASMVGVVDAAKKASPIKRVFGMRFGIEGVLQNFLLRPVRRVGQDARRGPRGAVEPDWGRVGTSSRTRTCLRSLTD